MLCKTCIHSGDTSTLSYELEFRYCKMYGEDMYAPEINACMDYKFDKECV